MTTSPPTSRDDLEYRLACLYPLVVHLEELSKQRQTLFNQQAHRFAAMSKRWGGFHFFGWGLIWTIVLAFSSFVGVFAWVYETKVKVLPSEVSAFMFLMPPLGALVLTTAMLIAHNMSVPRRNAKRERANQAMAVQIERDLAPQMKPLEADLAAAAGKVKDAYSGWFPQAYLSSDDVGACWRIVHDHRASTIEDAINRYRTDQHEQYLRDAARAQLEAQQLAARRAMVGNMINLAGHWGTQAALRSR